MSEEEHSREVSDDTTRTNCVTLLSDLASKCGAHAPGNAPTYPRHRSVGGDQQPQIAPDTHTYILPSQKTLMCTMLMQPVPPTVDAAWRYFLNTTAARPKHAHQNREKKMAYE